MIDIFKNAGILFWLMYGSSLVITLMTYWYLYKSLVYNKMAEPERIRFLEKQKILVIVSTLPLILGIIVTFIAFWLERDDFLSSGHKRTYYDYYHGLKDAQFFTLNGIYLTIHCTLVAFIGMLIVKEPGVKA